MRAALVMVVVVGGCAEGVGVEAGDVPSGARIDPPVTMSLESGLWFVGEPFSATVTGAPPGATVVLFRGTGSGTACLATSDPVCLDVRAPLRALGTTTADASGQAVFAVSVPPGARVGAAMALQALAWTGAGPMSGPETSGVVAGTLYDAGSPTFSSSDTGVCLTLDAATGRLRTESYEGNVAIAGLDPAAVDAVTGLVAEHGSAVGHPGTSIVDLGGGAYRVEADLAEVDFTETNPWTFDVLLEVEAYGKVFTSTRHWSISAVPERTAFMWVDGGYVAKTLPDVVLRPGNALYFGWSDMYGPASELLPGLTDLAGSGIEPDVSTINLLYYSTGSHYVTSWNEAYWYDFTLDSSTTSRVVFRADGCSSEGRVFFVQAADYDGSGVVDAWDLDAVDLESL